MNTADQTGSAVQIRRLTDLVNDVAVPLDITAQIDAIFFQTASRTFVDPDQRARFRYLWLGQYLDHDADKVHVAIERDRQRDGQQESRGQIRVLGYLVGCWENPVTSQRFASLPFFRDFAAQCRAFPGQLHVNLDAQARSRGIGRRLVDAFAHQSQAAGVPGIHVVTGQNARNVQFYARAGFTQQATTGWGGTDVVFLGRSLV